MSSKIIIDNIFIKNNPSLFQDNIEFEITFTSLEAIDSELEWKLIYVGSAKSQQCDQVLEEFQIGPIQAGTMKFNVECSPPDYHLIPVDQLICVTAVILTVSYKQQEFIRVGYYVHNVLKQDASQEIKNTKDVELLIKNTKRTILTDKPRITKFRINWDGDMKEETNKIIKCEYQDSSNSLSMGKRQQISQQIQEKQSTHQEKGYHQASGMKMQNSRGIGDVW